MPRIIPKHQNLVCLGRLWLYCVRLRWLWWNLVGGLLFWFARICVMKAGLVVVPLSLNSARWRTIGISISQCRLVSSEDNLIRAVLVMCIIIALWYMRPVRSFAASSYNISLVHRDILLFASLEAKDWYSISILLKVFVTVLLNNLHLAM